MSQTMAFGTVKLMLDVPELFVCGSLFDRIIIFEAHRSAISPLCFHTAGLIEESDLRRCAFELEDTHFGRVSQREDIGDLLC